MLGHLVMVKNKMCTIVSYFRAFVNKILSNFHYGFNENKDLFCQILDWIGFFHSLFVCVCSLSRSPVCVCSFSRLNLFVCLCMCTKTTIFKSHSTFYFAYILFSSINIGAEKKRTDRYMCVCNGMACSNKRMWCDVIMCAHVVGLYEQW